jgi:hypothetical protein
MAEERLEANAEHRTLNAEFRTTKTVVVAVLRGPRATRRFALLFAE